jgi:hypothetical protein
MARWQEASLSCTKEWTAAAQKRNSWALGWAGRWVASELTELQKQKQRAKPLGAADTELALAQRHVT